jgi:hypothetical protein
MSGEMVRAILDGRKTKTRRIMKPQPIGNPNHIKRYGTDGKWRSRFGWQIAGGEGREWKCPYGKVGDRLWVRESYTRQMGRGGYSRGRYNADAEWFEAPDKKLNHPTKKLGMVTIPSIHMPKWACRIFLEITGIRAERVQKISKEDALAEGIRGHDAHGGGTHYNNITLYAAFPEKGGGFRTPQEAFELLWDTLNEKRGFGWDENPWVWVIEFKVFESNQ